VQTRQKALMIVLLAAAFAGSGAGQNFLSEDMANNHPFFVFSDSSSVNKFEPTGELSGTVT